MADTTYTDGQAPLIYAAWLNDINNVAYRVLGTAGAVPTTVAQLLANLGLTNIVNNAVLRTSATGSALLPVGTTAQRDASPVDGMIRYNTDSGIYEGYGAAGWSPLAAGGATGGGTDQIFNLNGQTVTTNYSIPSGKSANSTGPITINSGITVTVPAGSRWVIL